MSDILDTFVRDQSEGPESALERKLILEYLQSKGYQVTDLATMPKEEADAIMKEACRYASFKLAEVEARSKFRRKIESPW